MNPFTPSFVPGFSHQHGQYIGSGCNNNNHENIHPFPPNAGLGAPHLPLMQPTNPMLVHSSRQSRFASPTPTPMAQLPFKPRQPEVISPTSHRSGPALLHKLRSMGIRDTAEHLKALPMQGISIDGVTEPSQMPIGSLVHHEEPPKWGVVKISNIPYSITKQEIFQFLGRQSRLIAPTKGCPIHIIMERSTAKTMDCYAEFETPADAKEAVNRINRIFETGRAPRLGNRHVDVELSDQNALLKDLFPRAKCVVWQAGIPYVLPNTDPYSTGFMGFFTSEEIIGAIRHAEIPNRSPFSDKCPQRTYESTVSTLYKFPWYASELYTVHDRNQLFELVNRHIISLVARIRRSNTVGLDQKLLLDLLRTGLRCPAFNERQKYTLCINSEEMTEILKVSQISKWFPFDTLVKMPNFSDEMHLYYALLVSKGAVLDLGDSELQNLFPMDNAELQSPYGRVWFEWPLTAAKTCTWANAVNHEMAILSHLVRSGWTSCDKEVAMRIGQLPHKSSPSTGHGSQRSISLSSYIPDKGRSRTESTSQFDIFATSTRRVRDSTNNSNQMFEGSGDCWNQKLLLYPSARARPRFLGHRITQSSPTCLPSSSTNSKRV